MTQQDNNDNHNANNKNDSYYEVYYEIKNQNNNRSDYKKQTYKQLTIKNELLTNNDNNHATIQKPDETQANTNTTTITVVRANDYMNENINSHGYKLAYYKKHSCDSMGGFRNIIYYKPDDINQKIIIHIIMKHETYHVNSNNMNTIICEQAISETNAISTNQTNNNIISMTSIVYSDGICTDSITHYGSEMQSFMQTIIKPVPGVSIDYNNDSIIIRTMIQECKHESSENMKTNADDNDYAHDDSKTVNENIHDDSSTNVDKTSANSTNDSMNESQANINMSYNDSKTNTSRMLLFKTNSNTNNAHSDSGISDNTVKHNDTSYSHDNVSNMSETHMLNDSHDNPIIHADYCDYSSVIMFI